MRGNAAKPARLHLSSRRTPTDTTKAFEELIAEAESWVMKGWDFSSFEGRWMESKPPWDYREKVVSRLPGVASLVDLGTGGGEFLSSVAPLPRQTVATEGYRPNVTLARDRLKQLGVEVVETYCEDNDKVPQLGRLPFKEGSADLIIDRHESFVAIEVFRVLKPSGKFITQQVGSMNLHQLNELLCAEAPEDSWSLEAAASQLELAGFAVTEKRKAELVSQFNDVGAVVMYLRAAPWQIPDFDVTRYKGKLKELDGVIRERGYLEATATRFLIEAAKP